MIRTLFSLLFAIAFSVWLSAPARAGFAEGKAAFDQGAYETALVEFQPLAEKQENPDAQYYVGLLYRNGWGVLQDDTEAARWFRLAAYQGNIESQYSLGYMYQHGQGVSADMEEAKRWYRKAAHQGDADAQQTLRIILYEEQNASKSRAGNQASLTMNDDPGDWLASVLSLIIGLEETMTIGDVVMIAAIVLIIAIPVVMPFSFYRIKPMLKEISQEAAERDKDLLEENKKITSLLSQIADTSADRDKAMVEALNRISRSLDQNQKDSI